MNPRASPFPMGIAWRAIGAGVLAFGLTAPCVADDAARTVVEQKIRLVARLMADSATARRISSSNNAAAKAHLDEGRVYFAMAEERLAGGDVAGARKAVDDALGHLGQARRMVPDVPANQAAARERYGQLLASVERLIDAWRARASIQAPADAGDLTSAIGLVGTARRLGDEERFDDAIRTLAQAEQHVLSGMNRTLHAATLDYTLRPTSPAEEYRDEMARLTGFADLLPLAVRDLKPSPGAMVLIERYAETSSTLRNQAIQSSNAGDNVQALVQLRSATMYLQRALLAAGLASPQPTGTPP